MQEKPPLAIIRIAITTIHPHPNNPERCDQGVVAPLLFEIHTDKNIENLPQGMISDIRKLLGGVVKHCRTYVAKEPELPPQDPFLAKPDTIEEQGVCPVCNWRESECECRS